MIFHTKRILIRKLTINDLSDFHRMHSNSKVMQYTSGQPVPFEDDKKDIIHIIDNYSNNKSPLSVWAAVHKMDSKFIGTVALVQQDNGGFEIGYRLLEECWGLGYGHEMCDGLIDYAMNVIKSPSLIAFVDSRNTASVKILNNSRLSFVRVEDNHEMNSLDRVYLLNK